jgi:hypothetical protein
VQLLKQQRRTSKISLLWNSYRLEKTYANISVRFNEEHASVPLVGEYITEQGYEDYFSMQDFITRFTYPMPGKLPQRI